MPAVLPKRARGQTAPHEPSRGPVESEPATPRPVGATTAAPNEPTTERIDAPPGEPARALIAHPPRRGPIAAQPGASVWEMSGVSPVSRAPTAPHESSTSHEPPPPRVPPPPRMPPPPRVPVNTIVENFGRRRAEEVALQHKKIEEELQELTEMSNWNTELQAEIAQLRDRVTELETNLTKARTKLQVERAQSHEIRADLDLMLNAQREYTAGHDALMTRLRDEMQRIASSDDAARPPQ
jgi:regulator of replication initiation timing